MDPAIAHASVPTSVAFEDGLGQRRLAVAADRQLIDVLHLREGLTASVPLFELLVRERVSRLASFQHECFSRVRAVERLGQTARLTLVSDHVPGVRLTDILAKAEQQLLPLEIDAVRCLIRQVVGAVAALHEKSPNVCHGAIAPERIVITPDARAVIVENTLGAALEQLRYSRERYWTELRVPLPQVAGAVRVDRRADVTQLGTLALALILSRPLRDDEYPAKIDELVEAAWVCSGTRGFEPISDALRTWLRRALQLDPTSSFGSAVEAFAELDRAFGEGDPAAIEGGLRSFLEQCHATAGTGGASAVASITPLAPVRPLGPIPSGSTPTIAAPTPSVATPALRLAASEAAVAKLAPSTPLAAAGPQALTGRPRLVEGGTETTGGSGPLALAASPASPAPHPEAIAPVPSSSTPTIAALPSSVATPVLRLAVPEPAVAKTAPSALTEDAGEQALSGRSRIVEGGPESTGRPTVPSFLERAPRHQPDEVHPPMQPDRSIAPRFSRGRLIGVAVAVIVLISGITLMVRRYFAPPAAGETTGTLVVSSNPVGAAVVVDGKPRGETPVTVALAPGNHVLELMIGDEQRSFPIDIKAGSQVSQFIELPRPSSVDGQLQVRTVPPGAKVTVDGALRGTSPFTVTALSPGSHQVILENEFGSLTETVTIESGTTASLVVPLKTSQGPSSGWISVSAPADVQLYEDERLIGSSRSDRLMVAAGRHQIDIVNEALGYRSSRTLEVAAGQVSAIKIDFPRGSVSVNALPWANVSIDGEAAGETPIGNLSLPIGTHEIVFRHPELGERRSTVTVTLTAPSRVSVDMRQK